MQTFISDWARSLEVDISWIWEEEHGGYAAVYERDENGKAFAFSTHLLQLTSSGTMDKHQKCPQPWNAMNSFLRENSPAI